MKLKCRIHGKDYEMVQGVPFSDELNETLDSVSIIIPVVEGEIEDLRPYDDVYIYDADKTFNGVPFQRAFANLELKVEKIEPDKIILSSPEYKDNFFSFYSLLPSFVYFSVNYVNYTFEVKYDNGRLYLQQQNYPQRQIDINLYNPKERIVLYAEVFNEEEMYECDVYERQTIKVKGKKPNIWYKHFLIDQFSYEVLNIEQGTRKYTIDLFSETKGLETVQLPNTPITSPMNLNKSTSALVKIINFLEFYSPKIKAEKNILLRDCEEWEFRQKYSIDADSFSEYSEILNFDMSFNLPSLRDVLTQIMLMRDKIPVVKDNVIYALDLSKKGEAFQLEQSELVNLAGSRSSENHADILKRTHSQALSQDYSARRVQYLGFRNSDNALMTFENMRLEFTDELYKINKILMCYFKKASVQIPKEDGTKETKELTFLCKQDITPLILLNTRRNFLSEDWETAIQNPPSSIQEMANYKIFTLGYDIGSRTIDGWGTKYSYITGSWFSSTKTYIENIMGIIDRRRPYGIYEIGYFKKINGLPYEAEISVDKYGYGVDAMITHSDFQGVAKLKGLFFEVDANVFFNGATISTKDDATRDDLVVNDNPSSSLTVLEKDGIFQKSKVNRFGNEALVIQTRITDISRLQPLGSVYGDFIIYHREYSIYDNFISCIYYATKNYVLKNYYTSVFSKLRPFSIATYDESVRRAENKICYLLLSKTKKLFENAQSQNINFDYKMIGKFLSAFSPSPRAESVGIIDYKDKINYGIIKYKTQDYATDINVFSSGNSLCFNLKMFDNVSMGVYIDKPAPFNPVVDNNTADDYTGSLQGWYITSNDIGEVDTMGFYVGHVDDENFVGNKQKSIDEIYDNLFKLPKIEKKALTNIIGKEYNVSKDSKSLLDMTFQFEAIPDNDIVISPIFLKLSDLVATYQKNDTTTIISEQRTETDDLIVISGVWDGRTLLIGFSCSSIWFEQVKQNGSATVKSIVKLDKPINLLDVHDRIGEYEFEIEKVTEITNDYIEIEGTEHITIISGSIYSPSSKLKQEKKRKYKLVRITKYGAENHVLPDDRLFFFSSNGDILDPQNTIYLTYDNGSEENYTYRMRVSVGQEYELSYDYNAGVYKTIIGKDNTIQEKAGDVFNVLQKFNKNMFVVLGEEKIDKTIAYEEKKAIAESLVKVPEMFSVEDDKIKVILPQENYKSIQYWFFDDISQTYKFVFGINPTFEEMQQGYAIIYCSLVSTRDERVFGWNNEQIGKVLNFVGSGKSLDKQYIERFIK